MLHTHADRDRAHHRKRWLLAAGAVALETVPLVRRGYGVGGNVIVRCHDGHLFSTL